MSLLRLAPSPSSSTFRHLPRRPAWLRWRIRPVSIRSSRGPRPSPDLRPHHYKSTGTGPPDRRPQLPSTTFTDCRVGEGTSRYQVRAAAESRTACRSAFVPAVACDHLRHQGADRAGGVTATAALDGSVGISWAAASDGPARASRATSCAGRCPRALPVVGRRRRRHLPGPVHVLRRRDHAQRQALQLRRVRRRRRRQHVAGRQLRRQSRRATSSRPAAPKGLVATPGDASVDLRWSGGWGGRRRGRLRARGQAGQRRARERGRRHARLHRDRRRLDRVLGDRSHERRHVHVRSLRARRGAQPLAGRPSSAQRRTAR